MRYINRFWLAPFLTILLGCVIFCTDDNPVNIDTTPNPPQGVIGYPEYSNLQGNPILMTLLWTGPSGVSADGYNVYRRIGDGDFVKLNDAPISESWYISSGINAVILHYVDLDYDILSDQMYTYYVTAV
ncbi:MAG: hypothetical protein JSV44_02155, partial [Candidatus Zixiibacteriota bacterium]